MKYIFLILLFCIALNACSSGQHSITYDEWKEEAKEDIRLFPKFGDALKTEDQKKADQKFIQETINQQANLLQSSEHLVKRGFQYLYAGDPKTAMYRFNQAWLLEPKNENVFWGFASVYFNFGDYENAMKQLNEGLALNPENSNILADKATIYLERFQTNKEQEELLKAIAIFKQSYRIAPNNQNTLYKLSIAFMLSGDCKNALKFYNLCKALGGKPITKEYSEAIAKNCKNQ